MFLCFNVVEELFNNFDGNFFFFVDFVSNIVDNVNDFVSSV